MSARPPSPASRSTLGAPGRPAAPSAPNPWPSRLVTLLAALVSLVYVGGLFDTPFTTIAALTAAPALAVAPATRDADVRVVVVDEDDRPLPGATVRLFSLRDDLVSFAGEIRAGDDGVAILEGMPRGEAWLLAYADGRARGSQRLVLGAGERVVRLVLRPALALDVVVVDETEKPFPGARITVSGGDPLPYVATTGPDGRTRIDRLGQGPFSVRASARGYDDIIRTGVVPGAVPLRIKLERLGAFEVTVVDSDGKPAPYARVLCAGTSLWPARSTIADEHGVARIVGLRRGSYDIKADLGDRVSYTELGLDLERAETKPIRLVLHPGRRITVKVTDGEADDAPPIHDASVILAEDGLSPFPIHGRTDDKGVVILGPITFGFATVSARAKGFVPRSAVPVGDDETEARVSLLRGGALVGEVVDDRGFPVGGATIEVVGVDIEGMPIDETSAMSEFREDHFDLALPGPLPLLPIGELGVMPGPIPDLPRTPSFGDPSSSGGGGDPWVTRADGEFRAEPIPPGRVYAIVRHPDYVEALSDMVTLKSGGEAFVRVVLHQGGSLEGRVVDADHRPVGNARVELAATAGTLERVTYTDDSGTFAFAAVPDEVLLSVARPETPSDIAARLIVEIPDGERKEVEIVLPRQRDSVVVHVTDDRGYPLDRVEVRTTSVDPAVALRRTLFTDDDGDVTIPDAAGLPLRFVLTRPSKAPLVAEVGIAPSKLTYELAEGLVAHGEVTGREGRERVEGADVAVYTEAGVRRAKTDAEGAFEVKDLAPGRVRIVALHADWAMGEKITAVAAAPSGSVDLGAVDLPEAGEVEGTVVDPDEEPVAGARVALGLVPTYLPLGALPPGVVTTDREGRFKLGAVPEGDATIEAYTSDLGRASVNVKVRAGRTTSRVDITLPGEGSARGESKGAGSVALTLGERKERGQKELVIVFVPPNGEAEIAGVEPGETLLAVNDREVRTIEDARRRISGPLSEDIVLTLLADVEGAKPRKLRVRRERVRR